MCVCNNPQSKNPYTENLMKCLDGLFFSADWFLSISTFLNHQIIIVLVHVCVMPDMFIIIVHIVTDKMVHDYKNSLKAKGN